jgi:AraC-like DNA-binding protein
MIYNRLYIERPVTYQSTGTFTAPQDWKHEKRISENFELIVMISGALYITVNGTNYSVHANQYLIVQPRDQRLSCDYTVVEGYKKSKCTYFWLHFKCNSHSFHQPVPTDFVTTDNNIYLPTVSMLSNPQYVFSLMRNLQDCVKIPYRNYIDYANYLSTLILCEIYHQFLDSYHTVVDNTKNEAVLSERLLMHQPSFILNRLTDYVNANSDHTLTVDTISQTMGYSGKYLSKIIKDGTGKTLKEYIQNRICERAVYLLLNTSLSVSEIASELKFPSSNNFSRFFKNEKGVSPSQYRDQHSYQINN